MRLEYALRFAAESRLIPEQYDIHVSLYVLAAEVLCHSKQLRVPLNLQALITVDLC